MQTREESLAQRKRYREANREKRAAYNREWWQKNKATKYLKNLAWRQSNPGRIAEYQRRYSEQIPWIRLLSCARKRARQKNMRFDLTNEWAREKWTGLCALSGQPMKIGIGGQTMLSPSIDRIDANRGYTQDNCRFVCLALNAARGDGTDEQLFELIRLAAAHIGR